MRQKRAELIENVGFSVILLIALGGLIFWHWPDALFHGFVGTAIAVGFVVFFFRERWRVPWFWFAVLINAALSIASAWLIFPALSARYRPSVTSWNLILIGYIAAASVANFVVQGVFRKMFRNERVDSRWRKTESNS